MKAIGKITAKSVMGEQLGDAVKLKLDGKSFNRYEAMRVQGRVDRVKISPSALNPENTDVRLSGEFIVTNVTTGEIYQSATMYPMGAGMADMMASAEPGSLFAMRVFLAPSAKTVQGYTFEFESAMEIKASEAVSQLSNAFLALPAPTEPIKEKAAKK